MSKYQLDRNAAVEQPLYLQIADLLRKQIESRQLLPGDRIPPTRELCKSLGVSTITVEAGIRQLVKEEFLIRHPRRGTFIRTKEGETLNISIFRRVRIIFCNISLTDHYWYIVLNALEHSCGLQGIEKLFNRITGEGNEDGYPELLNGCEGIFLCGYSPPSLVRYLNERHFPFVMIGGSASRASDPGLIDAVCHDDIHRAYLSTRHLLELEHRRICCVAGPGGSRLADDIEVGYRAALREYGVAPDASDFAVVSRHTIEAGREIGLRILSCGVRPSAVYACDDRLAVGIVKAALHLGFRLPEDLSIIGGGNEEIGKVVEPVITTTPSYPERSAELAVQKMVGQWNDPNHCRSRTMLQVKELVIGGSTRMWRPELNTL